MTPVVRLLIYESAQQCANEDENAAGSLIIHKAMFKLQVLFSLALAKGSNIQTCTSVCTDTGNNQSGGCDSSSDPTACRQGITTATQECSNQCKQQGTTGGKRKRALSTGMSQEQLESIEKMMMKRDDNCFFSSVWGMNICLDHNDMVELGRATSQSCDDSNIGQQVCVGTKGFVTCDNGVWSIRQPCGGGTTCQAFPTDANHKPKKKA
ncbi:hypothetical protein HDV06_001659 [Boothiomyces sp. JEL0866]|nr:hypothetical protein HDV06_001659 [Boothiomyces sp. JEL0866]